MQAILDLATSASSTEIHLILFGLIILSGLCLFSEDLVVVAAGVLAYQGLIEPWSALMACFLAVLLADGLLFLLGRKLGRGAFSRPWLKHLIPTRKIEAAQRLVERHGPRMILASRFLIGFRAPLFFTWGSLGIGLRSFFLCDALAAAVEVSALLLCAYCAGSGIATLTATLAGLGHVILTAAALLTAAGLTWWLIRRLRTASAAVEIEPEPRELADPAV